MHHWETAMWLKCMAKVHQSLLRSLGAECITERSLLRLHLFYPPIFLAQPADKFLGSFTSVFVNLASSSSSCMAQVTGKSGSHWGVALKFKAYIVFPLWSEHELCFLCLISKHPSNLINMKATVHSHQLEQIHIPALSDCKEDRITNKHIKIHIILQYNVIWQKQATRY